MKVYKWKFSDGTNETEITTRAESQAMLEMAQQCILQQIRTTAERNGRAVPDLKIISTIEAGSSDPGDVNIGHWQPPNAQPLSVAIERYAGKGIEQQQDEPLI